MNKKKIIALIATLAVFCLILVACASIDGIRFDTQPRTTYVRGQDIDLDEAVLVALSGDKTEPVDPTQVTITGYDKNTLGQQTVTFTYKEKSTTLNVNVIPRIAVEGAATNYFVKDVFNKNEGRIKVANDEGKTQTVNMSDARVEILDFDSTAAALGKPVTIKFGEYTDTFNVNIYEAETVELSARPKRLTYFSHEEKIDLTGAYFTVKAKDNAHQAYVSLTDDMISGYRPELATPEHMVDGLNQTITVNYLGTEKTFDVTIRFSGVSLMILRGEELEHVTNPNNVTKEDGDNAIQAIREYMKLTDAQRELIGQENIDRVALIATVYGFKEFKVALDSFSGSLELVAQVFEDDESTEEDESKTAGSFKIIAESYEIVVADLERLGKKDEPFVILCELLAEIEEEFPNMEIEGKNIDEYLDLIYDTDTLDIIIGLFEHMCELHEEFENIPDDWTVDTLPNYKGNIKLAVTEITTSDFNPFSSGVNYTQYYNVVSSWRKNDDYFKIIYTYYLEHENDSVVAALWEKVPFPGQIQDLYTVIRYGLIRTNNMRVGTDTTNFMYYYREARRISDEIKARNDAFEMKLYERIDFDYLIDAYFYMGNAVNGIAYIYYAGSLEGNEKYEAFMEEYLKLVDDIMTTEGDVNFADPTLYPLVVDLLDAYIDFTPAERLAFINALHCDFRFNSLSENILDYVIQEGSGVLATYNWFTRFIYYSYREVLSEEGFDILRDLLVASEDYTLVYRYADRLDKFMTNMESVVERYASLPDADKQKLAGLYGEYERIYNERLTPTNPEALPESEVIFEELDEVIDLYFEVNYALINPDTPTEERPVLYALRFSLHEKAQKLAKLIIEGTDENAKYRFAYVQKLFDTDRDEVDGNDDLSATYDYILEDIAAEHRRTVKNAEVSVTKEDGTEVKYYSYKLYYITGTQGFFATAADIMAAAYKGTTDELSYEAVLAALAEFRTLSDNGMFGFHGFSGSILYYDAVLDVIYNNVEDEEIAMMAEILIRAEKAYIAYISQDGEISRAAFYEAMDAVTTMLEDVDESRFADFKDMYDFYMDKYDSIKKEEASTEE